MKPAIRLVAFIAMSLAVSSGTTRAQSNSVFNVCPGTYALCTTAVCQRTPTPGVLECMCTVNQGYSLGIGTQAQCPAQSGATIPSRYFPMTAYQVCNAKPTSDHPWADCLNAPCTVDPNNKTVARCSCHTVDKESYAGTPSYPWLVVTSQIRTNLCTNGTIYSSATTAAAQAVTNAFNAYNQATPPAQLSIPTALQGPQ